VRHRICITTAYNMRSLGVHPDFNVELTSVKQQATTILTFFDNCIKQNVECFCYRGNDETYHLPAAVNDDFILDCLLYYHSKYEGYATLLSHDWQLCCKAELFQLKSIYSSEHEEWQHLVRTCEVNDIPLDRLPQMSVPRPKVCTGPYEYDEDELLFRRNRYRDTLAQFITIDELEARRLELPRGIPKWKPRPSLSRPLVFS